MATQFKAIFPHGCTQQEAEEWLQQNGVYNELNAVLRPVLVELWEKGYTQGLTLSGGSTAAYTATFAVAALMGAWLQQILRTTVKLIAKALLAGTAIAAYLADRSRAETIAITEANRAITQAVMDSFNKQGVTHIRWVCFPGCCAACQSNEDAGPWPLGVPFPSGALCPPDHPNCRCHIEKAD